MKRNLMLIVLCMGLLVSQFGYAQSLGYNNNRIAISADGNNQPDNLHKWSKADPDDWGATPATLAIIAKLKLQNKLVHFSYNNFIESPKHTTATNHMKIGADGAISHWNYDSSRFFDVSANLNAPLNHLANEMAKSTKSNPLYFVHMGPSEFFYRAVDAVKKKGKIASLSHVYVISHSGYNDNHLRRGDPKFDKKPVPANKKHHTMQQAIALSGNRIKYKKIIDQNAGDNPNKLWKSHKNWSVWYWMRDHKDASIRWIYDRMKANANNSADISDAGMVYYLLLGDENGSPSKFKNFLGNGISTNGNTTPTNPNPSTGCSNLSLNGVKDFQMKKIGNFVMPYKDTSRDAIAVDAVKYKNKFAATQKVFDGNKGSYNITLTTLTEIDGESTYRLVINGKKIGQFQNPVTTKDMAVHRHTFKNITVNTGDIIQIESNTHSNGKIPEGNAFAFARGRWRSIDFECLNGSNGNGSNGSSGQNCVVEEKNGLLIFEAERFPMKGQWKIGTDAQKASGGKYIYYNGANAYSQVDKNNVISYTFKINNPGSYTVKWMMRQPEGERGTDKGNDVYIYFSDNIGWAKDKKLTHYEKFYSRSGDDFKFDGVAEIHGAGHGWLSAKFPSAGTYTLNIGGRSHGIQIDRIVMFKGLSTSEVTTKLSQMAETTKCDEAPTPSTGKDEISFATVPKTMDQNQLSHTVKVKYDAKQDRDIVVEFWNDKWIAATKKTVKAGNGTASFTVTLPSKQAVGTNYVWKASIRPKGTDWKSNIQTKTQPNVSIQTGSNGNGSNGSNGSSGQNCVVEEKDGLLIFEAERFQLKGQWKIGTDAQKASGGKYIYYNGANNYSQVDKNNVISYTFKINNPGSYTVKWMMRQPEGERGTDKGNDVYIYFSDNIGWAKDKTLTHYEKFYSRSGDDFKFDGVAEIHGAGHGWLSAKFPSAGTYTLNIGGRSHGLQIDRIVMFKGLSTSQVTTKLSQIAETTKCDEAPTPSTGKDKISFANVPTKMAQNQLSHTIKVNYTAKQSRDIVVEFWNDKWIAASKKTVQAGSGTASITVNLPKAQATGTNYNWRASIRPVGTNWQSNIANIAQNNVSISSTTTTKDQVSFKNLGSSFTSKKSYTVQVNYTAKESRDIVVELWKDKWLGATKKTVQAGSGTINLTVNLASAPAAGKDYSWKTAIRPVGTDWKSNLDIKTISNIEVKSNTVPVQSTLSTLQDTYLENSANKNNNLLRIENNRRVVYLLFDLSKYASITSANLKMICSGDGGNGTIEVYSGSTTNWTETNLNNGNKPYTSSKLGSLNQNYNVGSTYTWNLDASKIKAGGKLALIVKATGGNDVAFGSKENGVGGPKLTVNGNQLKALSMQDFSELKPFSENKVEVYPNPFTETISISINDGANYSDLHMLDTSGRIVYSTKLPENCTIYQLTAPQVTNAPTGLYFINLVGKNQSVKHKIIKK